NGSVFCWGNNSDYEFGNGTNIQSLVPTIAMNSTSFSSPTILSLSAGNKHACAIDGNNKLYCWGANDSGQLGIGNTASQNAPTEIDTTNVGVSNNFRKVSTSWSHTCAIHDNNKLYCWGNNNYGFLGIGNEVVQTSPVEVAFTSIGFTNQIKDVDVGISGTCAIDMNNKGFCWGDNTWGELGIGFMGNYYNLPQQIEDMPPEYARFKTLKAAHGRHTCGIGTNGKTYCWVFNTAGQLGNGTSIMISSHPMDLEVNVTNVQ
ncbi:MAG: hypothetical protein R2877_08715, partial [Bdellovibrionota bacterium]